MIDEIHILAMFLSTAGGTILQINRTRIRNLDLYVHPDLTEKFVRVVSDPRAVDPSRLGKAGLVEMLAEGESYLPPQIGRITRYNADGRWEPNKILPKESRYVRTIYWKWTQFAGGGATEEMEDSRDIYRMCYQRTLVAPPADEVFGFPIAGHVFLATEAIALPTGRERLLHQVNMMLELFGNCEVVRADGTSASPAITHRRWAFLPTGPYKKGDIARALKPVLDKLGDGDRLILTERQDLLTELDPQEVARGQGGFNDYLAYVFPQYERVVLESLRRDNAIYIFRNKWEQFSRLTKREILDQGVHDARILHTKGWQSRLKAALGAV